MGKVVCVSIGVAMWACLSCAGSGSPSSSQTMGAQDSGLADCVAEVSDAGAIEPYDSFVSGSFSGGMSGELCKNGAFGYFERASGSISIPSQLLLIVTDNSYAAGGTEFHFGQPGNATGGELGVMIGGMSSPSAGTYTSSDACGSIVLAASLPVTVDCATTDGSCPPGCELEGPVLGLTCHPIVPEVAYEAHAAGDCVGGSTSPQGSWSPTLSSVALYEPPDGSFGTGYYIVHGTLSARLVGGDASAASTTDLKLSF